jgi:hypothetical protein
VIIHCFIQHIGVSCGIMAGEGGGEGGVPVRDKRLRADHTPALRKKKIRSCIYLVVIM